MLEGLADGGVQDVSSIGVVWKRDENEYFMYILDSMLLVNRSQGVVVVDWKIESA